MKDPIRHTGRTLTIGARSVELNYPIREAWGIDGGVVVLFDPDAETRGFGQFQNLICLDREGRLLWRADLPTSITGDRYYRVSSRDPLIVYSVKSWECTIDASTGRITKKDFFR